MGEEVRIDKYLWAIRVFKTRSQATDACRSGKVLIREQQVKPSREVQPGDEVTVRLSQITRTFRVDALLSNRVSAKLVDQYATDLTSDEEYEKLKMKHKTNYEYRKKGVGRPTKRERRMIEKLKKSKF